MIANQWKRKNYDSGTGKITTQESENLRCNYTNRVKSKKILLIFSKEIMTILTLILY